MRTLDRSQTIKHHVSRMSRNHCTRGCRRYLNWRVDRFRDQKVSQKEA